MKIISIALILLSLLSLVSCGDKEENKEGSKEINVEIDLDTIDYSQSMDFSYTARDKETGYNEAECEKITFSDKGSTITKGGNVVGSTVAISTEGSYIVSGEASDAQLVIEIPDASKVRLILNSLNIKSAQGPAIYIKSADKVFITLAKGSVNTLSDSKDYQPTEAEASVDSALFSKADLTINGEGTLNVNGNYKHGISSKDDLVITGGNINVSSIATGIEGKDAVKIGGGRITVVSGTDGIRSTNAEDVTKGYVYIDSGYVNVTSGTDAIQAETVALIKGGELTLTSGGGSYNSSSAQGGWGQWGTGTDSDSAKGIKGKSQTRIEGGIIVIDSSDDSIHSDIKVEILSGYITLSSGDDGVHADDTLIISGGSLKILKSYEGIESTNINISGGNTSVVASDDGINAAGGNDGSAMGTRPGMGSFSQSSGAILISGGYNFINSTGDGIDANGQIIVTGGTTLVSGPTNSGNGSFDYDMGASVMGGVLIALGSSGMAQGFSSAQNQGAILVTFTSQAGDTGFCITDKDDNVIASFTPPKAYNCAVITSPNIQDGEEYYLYAGASIVGADANGYAVGSKAENGTLIKKIEMTSNLYGSGEMDSGMNGGMGGGRPPR